MKKAILVKMIMIMLIILSIFSLKKFFKKDIDSFTKPSIILYRILGNDLPPRHSFNQTLTNLLFILQNEPSFTNVTKIWVLNRIVNNHTENILIDLLNQYKQIYIRIPFHWKKYRQIPYYFPLNYPSDDYFDTKKLKQSNPHATLGLIDTIYHKKNLYVMNNNGARNFALRHGKRKTQAHWLMIFDGNCFLSQQGFDEIQQSLLINGSRLQYFIVPMKRIINNSEIFHMNGTIANEEPQVIFRRDSSIEFHETMRYGQRPKQELLAYLGIKKYIWKLPVWTPKERKPMVLLKGENNSLFQYTSFVFRLFSGSGVGNERSWRTRLCNRYEGVLFFLDSLDFQITHHKLLPKLVKIRSRQCAQWSDEQLKKIVQTARHSINIKVSDI